jgi:hypothetical protein
MGRGLSDLECYILAAAAGRPRVYHAEVLAGFFGWRTLRPLQYEDGRLLSPGSPRFSAARIGKSRYNEAKNALRRACRRLEEGGLVTYLTGPGRRGSAVEITDKGRQWLSVNTREAGPDCQAPDATSSGARPAPRH